MGAPISAILSEIYLQYIDHNYIYKILQNTTSTAITYVDDILIVYNTKKTNIANTL
jgi:hypothetical protein